MHKIWYYMKGDESGQMHQEMFISILAKDEWMKKHGDAIEIFKEEDQ